MNLFRSILNRSVEHLKESIDPDIEDESYVPQRPQEGVLFKEGYLMKHSRTRGANVWNRRFFILTLHPQHLDEGALLTYTESFNTPSSKTKKFKLRKDSFVKFTEAVDITTRQVHQELVLKNIEFISSESDSEETSLRLRTAESKKNVLGEERQLLEWQEVIEKAIQALRGDTIDVVNDGYRFFEGDLFKLTHDGAFRWMMRHFELDGPFLNYYQHKGGELRGRINLVGAQIKLRRTEADSAPTKLVFQVHGKKVKLDLAARNKDCYLAWLKAIHQNLGIAMAKAKTEPQTMSSKKISFDEEPAEHQRKVQPPSVLKKSSRQSGSFRTSLYNNSEVIDDNVSL